jgi:glycyl-tRNA synthetase beta chain
VPNFLLEIGCEEIPDWMIEPALADLHKRFAEAFVAFRGSSIATDATPRRLVLQAKDLIGQAPDVEAVIQGPYLSAGEKAAEGFAKKQNTTIDKLAKITDAKGERYVSHQLVKGQAAAHALAEKLPEIIKNITFPKTMYWTGKGGVKFIRPIRWIVALLDDQIIPFEIAGVKSGNLTRGHRILGSKSPIFVTIDTYVAALHANFVIVSAEERRARIEKALVNGVEKDEDLLNTLVYLTEFPTPFRGSFDKSYLELPKEILSTVMRHHQRYFSVLQPDGSLAPEFVAVTNTDGDPEGLIRQGNERVLRARFNDARFFWQVDQQKKLSDRVADLEKVTFQAKLGSYKDKTERVRVLAKQIAEALKADQKTVDRAALLAKTDLTTDMVKEFTELQGVVGGRYAEAQGESAAVATAIYDHYQPASMEAPIPRTLEGQVVSIADRLDTLRECFRVGLIPTGSKDPLALRRAAQGVVKILFDANLPLLLLEYLERLPSLEAFMMERIQFYLHMKSNGVFTYDEIAAVTAPPMTTLPDLYERAEAVNAVRATDNFEPLAASFKRIKKILLQWSNGEKLSKKAFPVHPELFEGAPEAGPESILNDAFLSVSREVKVSTSYKDKLVLIAALRPHIDCFFDNILVIHPEEKIRDNRLNLLSNLYNEFLNIADFSEIVTQGVSA